MMMTTTKEASFEDINGIEVGQADCMVCFVWDGWLVRSFVGDYVLSTCQVISVL